MHPTLQSLEYLAACHLIFDQAAKIYDILYLLLTTCVVSLVVILLAATVARGSISSKKVAERVVVTALGVR